MDSDTIVRSVKVNRTRTPQEALDATNRKQYLDPTVVVNMPRGEGDEVEVILFKPEAWEYTRPGYISDDDLEKCFERRNLKPAFPDDLAAMNEADQAFADTHPNATHWKNWGGKWCCASFNRWNDERDVLVVRRDFGWDDAVWFAGSRKVGS